MTKNEWAILSQLLEMAAEDFGHHGSNDFELPNTPENYAFMEQAELWNAGSSGEPYPLHISRDRKMIYTSDAFLMDYFAYLTNESAK